MRDESEGTYRGGPRLVRNVAEVQTSYDFSLKVKVTIQKI